MIHDTWYSLTLDRAIGHGTEYMIVTGVGKDTGRGAGAGYSSAAGAAAEQRIIQIHLSDSKAVEFLLVYKP